MIISQPQPSDFFSLLVTKNTHCLNVLKATATDTFNMFWYSADKTPQEVCDYLGVDAGISFTAHQKIQELIYLLDATWIPLSPPLAYVVNEDGTVTIGA
jgi:hypothetical protein